MAIKITRAEIQLFYPILDVRTTLFLGSMWFDKAATELFQWVKIK